MPTPLPRYNMVPAGSERKTPLLSRHAHRRAFLASLPTPPPPPPADYEVTGTLTPDATGQYSRGDDYAGYPYYERSDAAYCIWWYSRASQWVLSTTPPNRFPGYWKRSTPITGDYTPSGTHTGIATVTAI